jgi:hypothetical protein
MNKKSESDDPVASRKNMIEEKVNLHPAKKLVHTKRNLCLG